MPADRTTQNTAIALLLAVVLYLASPPFVIWVAERTHAVYLMGNWFDVFYAPASWLFENCPPYRWYLESACSALGVH